MVHWNFTKQNWRTDFLDGLHHTASHVLQRAPTAQTQSRHPGQWLQLADCQHYCTVTSNLTKSKQVHSSYSWCQLAFECSKVGYFNKGVYFWRLPLKNIKRKAVFDTFYSFVLRTWRFLLVWNTPACPCLSSLCKLVAVHECNQCFSLPMTFQPFSSLTVRNTWPCGERSRLRIE